MLWEPSGRIQVALTGAKEAGAWALVCAQRHAESQEESPEDPALQPLAKKHHIHEYKHEKSPLPSTLCLFPLPAGGKVGGGETGHMAGDMELHFAFSPLKTQTRAVKHIHSFPSCTRDQLERGCRAELPRHPGAELQWGAANKQQWFAAVYAREVSTQRQHNLQRQRPRAAPALTVCFLHRQVWASPAGLHLQHLWCRRTDIPRGTVRSRILSPGWIITTSKTEKWEMVILEFAYEFEWCLNSASCSECLFYFYCCALTSLSHRLSLPWAKNDHRFFLATLPRGRGCWIPAHHSSTQIQGLQKHWDLWRSRVLAPAARRALGSNEAISFSFA